MSIYSPENKTNSPYSLQYLSVSDNIIFSSTEDVSRLSLAGLSLSSVTAQVGKQIGAISAGNGQNKTTHQTKIHHPTLLHKKLYDRNLIVNNNVKTFFKVKICSLYFRKHLDFQM